MKETCFFLINRFTRVIFKRKHVLQSEINENCDKYGPHQVPLTCQFCFIMYQAHLGVNWNEGQKTHA